MLANMTHSAEQAESEPPGLFSVARDCTSLENAPLSEKDREMLMSELGRMEGCDREGF